MGLAGQGGGLAEEVALLVEPVATDVQHQLEGGNMKAQDEAEVVAIDQRQGGRLPLHGPHRQEGVTIANGAAVAQQQLPLAVFLRRIGHLIGAEEGGAVDVALMRQIDRADERLHGRLLPQIEQHGFAGLAQQRQRIAVGLLGMPQHVFQHGHGAIRRLIGLQQQTRLITVVQRPAAEQHGQCEYQQGDGQTQPGPSRVERGGIGHGWSCCTRTAMLTIETEPRPNRTKNNHTKMFWRAP
ncbi:hypothetical protein D3C78_911460 [compost metagenome]